MLLLLQLLAGPFSQNPKCTDNNASCASDHDGAGWTSSCYGGCCLVCLMCVQLQLPLQSEVLLWLLGPIAFDAAAFNWKQGDWPLVGSGVDWNLPAGSEPNLFIGVCCYEPSTWVLQCFWVSMSTVCCNRAIAASKFKKLVIMDDIPWYLWLATVFVWVLVHVMNDVAVLCVLSDMTCSAAFMLVALSLNLQCSHSLHQLF